MSVAFHLAALVSERLMIALSRPKTEVTSLASGSLTLRKQDARSDSSTSNKIHGMKEFSLINHIESLKATAYGDVCNSSEKQKNTHDLPFISSHPHNLSLCHANGHGDSGNPSPTSKWAVDPGSVDGNLRVNSRNRSIAYTVEDFISRGSSCAKHSDVCEDDDVAEKSSNRSRKKSAKGTKKKVKRKDSRSVTLTEKDPKLSTPSSVYSNLKKKRDSSSNINACDLSVLTALCQSIKIHPKSSNNISVQDAPYSKKSSAVVTNVHRKSISPSRTSLSNAMQEYGKKLSIVSDHRRKQTSSVEEASKTKVFLSEKQSGLLFDCGISFPCAPPATPTTDQLKRIEYVPSLQDIRSQRSIRQRLQMMENKALKKERKKQVDVEKNEKTSMREKRIEKKKKQRLEVYALNKLMTEFEHERFKQFMAQAGSNL